MRYYSAKTEQGNIGVSSASQYWADFNAAELDKAGCVNCVDCFNCRNCSDCRRCEDCDNCQCCFECNDCRRCKTCHHCAHGYDWHRQSQSTGFGIVVEH